jgi:Uma2 family endonuclease
MLFITVAIDKLSFADYCSYTDGSDRRYELVDGELIPMSLGTAQHGAIAEYLNEIFKAEIRQRNLPWTAKDMRIGIQPTFSRLFKTKNNIGEKTSQETAKSNFVCQ